MDPKAVNFKQKFTKFTDRWSPKVIAQMNDYQFKLVRLEGDFVWHDHKKTDEVFIVIEGKMRIDLRNKSIDLKEGELVVIPKGMEHKPFAEEECKILLVEPAGTVNTGEAGGDKTAANDICI